MEEDRSSSIYEFLYPRKEELPNDKEMAIFYHLEELWERIFVSVLAVGAVITGCFAFSKDLIVFLEAPVKTQGVRFLQLAPGKFFFYYSKGQREPFWTIPKCFTQMNNKRAVRFSIFHLHPDDPFV